MMLDTLQQLPMPPLHRPGGDERHRAVALREESLERHDGRLEPPVAPWPQRSPPADKHVAPAPPQP
jgi:hypothetical protein